MSDDEDFALLLEGANKIQLDLAKNLLAEAGIPSLTKGPDFDVAELGRSAHDTVRGQDLYVPHAAFERAKEVLEAAWGEDGPSQSG